MKILVMGATGFIGSNIMTYLDNKGYTVFGCGRTQIKHGNGKYVSCDLAKDIPDTRADVVIHAAGICPSKDIDFNDYFENNIMVTRNVIKYAKQYKVKRIIYIGTLSSYGKVDNVLTEDSPHNDPDAYGLTKYVAEQLIRNSEIPYYILNVATVVGEGIKNSWIFRAAKAMLNNEDVYYYNGQEQYNNILEVRDLCKFAEMLLTRDGYMSEVYLLGSSEITTIEEILLFIKKHLSSASRLIDNGKNDNVFSLDISKSISAGFSPKSIWDTLEIVCKEVLK